MKTTAYYIKTTVLAFLLFVESLFLTDYLTKYIKTQEYLTFQIETILIIMGLLLALAYTQALTIGAWNKWLQFLIIPIPIALGISVVLLPDVGSQALIAGVVAGLLSLYTLVHASKTLSLFVRVQPAMVLKTPTSGIFTIFSLVAIAIVTLNPMDLETLNLGEKIGEIVNTQIQSYVESDKTLGPLTQFGIVNLDFTNQVATGVDTFIEPYKKWVTPVLSVLMFFLIKGLGSVVSIFYGATIAPIFWFAKRIKFFNIELETVEREKLTFEKITLD